MEDIVIYDLYYNFQKYSDFAQLGSLFVFFHMMERGAEAYPLYFVEVEYRTSNSEATISFPRNLMLLNTPAVNYFKFDSVLTVPRASSVATTKSHLGAIETFIQTQYGFQEPFILEQSFSRITHANESFPSRPICKPKRLFVVLVFQNGGYGGAASPDVIPATSLRVYPGVFFFHAGVKISAGGIVP